MPLFYQHCVRLQSTHLSSRPWLILALANATSNSFLCMEDPACCWGSNPPPTSSSQVSYLHCKRLFLSVSPNSSWAKGLADSPNRQLLKMCLLNELFFFEFLLDVLQAWWKHHEAVFTSMNVCLQIASVTFASYLISWYFTVSICKVEIMIMSSSRLTMRI